ncbi:MAG: SIS domain-containing protein [Capsulimonadaceae bacterium]
MTDPDVDEWLHNAQRVLLEASDALVTIAGRLERESWACAVRRIVQARGRVVVTGMGKSGAVGRKLSSTLASTGTHAFFMHPAEAVHGDLGMLTGDDVVIALSYSGETDEIVALLPALRARRLPIIALTANRGSRLAEASEVVIDVTVEKEACPMNLAPTTSTTAMIAVGDALAMSVMSARGFTQEDYARLHPAGSLGRRLTLRVADVMRTGDSVAIVPSTATVMETLLAMTRAQYGAAIVTGERGKVCGLIVDGDIRRHLLENPDNMLGRPASSIMNASPGMIPPHILAVEGLRRLEDFHPVPGSRVGEAPVIDSEGCPIGMLTLKNLIQAGIALQ